MRTVFAPILLTACLAQPARSAPPPPPISPSPESARQNAFFIFNSVHSAMRQWGSSLNHNGLALIPATAPRGTVFYHGTTQTETPPGPEWLGFEIEHSEAFALSWRPGQIRRPPKRPPNEDPVDPPTIVDADARQMPLQASPEDAGDVTLPTRLDEDPDGDPDPDGALRGYLHTYRATRDLNLLYADGMGAAKAVFGTLDTQDLVLRGRNDSQHGRPDLGQEFVRAREICDLITTWGYDGLIRMEVGFEIIYCNFTAGLGFVSALRRPFSDEPGGEGIMESTFPIVRAVSQRYDDIGGRRIRLDFSRMVSGLFYPINVTNPDPKMPELPRLVSATMEERRAIRDRARDVASEAKESVDWRGVVDMIVARYSDRLAFMASDDITAKQFVYDLVLVTATHHDFPPSPEDVNLQKDDGDKEREQDARRRCESQYLLPLAGEHGDWTPEDGLLYTAISHVSAHICKALFDARAALLDAVPALARGVGALDQRATDDDKLADAVRQGRGILRELTAELRWTTWKKCRGCKVDEICFVAMWPLGRHIDHYSPACLNETDFESVGMYEHNYWGLRNVL